MNDAPSVLQGLLGHTKYETIEGYVQLFDRTKATSAGRVAIRAAALLDGRPKDSQYKRPFSVKARF